MHGMTLLADFVPQLNQTANPVLGNELQRAGYRTGFFGKWCLSGFKLCG